MNSTTKNALASLNAERQAQAECKAKQIVLQIEDSLDTIAELQIEIEALQTHIKENADSVLSVNDVLGRTPDTNNPNDQVVASVVGKLVAERAKSLEHPVQREAQDILDRKATIEACQKRIAEHVKALGEIAPKTVDASAVTGS